MRQLVSLLVISFLFVVSFVAIYISFRTSAPQIRALVGGGFFLLTSFVLLWKDLTSASPKKVF